VAPQPRHGTTPKTSYWVKRWKNIEKPASALIEDFMLFAILLAVLTLSFLGLGALAALGYPAQRVETFETLHYYAYLSVLTTFLIDMVSRIVIHVFRKPI
jgi:hypothetical protein